MLVCLITSDIYMIKLISAGFLHCKVTIFYFVLVSFLERVLPVYANSFSPLLLASLNIYFWVLSATIIPLVFAQW